MNTRTIVTVMAAAILSAGLVSASVAQGTTSSTREGIEVITIFGKRAAPVIATPGASGSVTSADAAVEMQTGNRNVSSQELDATRTNTGRSTPAGKHHIKTVVSAPKAQI